MIFVKSTILTGNLLKLINFQFANFYPGGAISQPNKVLVLQRAGAPKKVLNSGLGPKWDQSSKLVPKKSRFCLQVPNFCLCLQMLLKRGGTQQLGHCCALFRHIQCIMCMYLILSGPLMRVSYLLTIRYILKWEMLRQCVFCLFCMFFAIS